MSLETLLEAARYVEQQELRAKQLLTTINSQTPQINHHLTNNNHQIPRQTSFKIVSPLPISTNNTNNNSIPVNHLPQSPSTAVVVPQVNSVLQQVPQGHSLVAAGPLTNGSSVQTPRTSGHVVQGQNPPMMVATQQQSGVVEVIQKSPPTITLHSSLPTNGFDKTTTTTTATLLIDENNQQQQQQDLKKQTRNHVPSVMRSGTREVHNKLEKNRRAHLKECFELLKKQLPPQQDEKKSSNLSILHSALRFIQGLKKKERENEHEMERLARDKIAAQQRLAALKKEVGSQWDNIDFTALIPEIQITTPTSNGNLPNITSVPTITSAAGVITTSSQIKEERTTSDSEESSSQVKVATTLQPTQLSVLPIQQVGYPVSQGLVLGVQKVALLSKSLPLVSSPVTHIIAAQSQLNGKVVPLVNAQYLMKPVVVVSTPNTASTAISPRPS